MKRSVDELLAIIYRYCPRGLYPDDPGYQDTEEHRRLVQARIQAGVEGNPWDVLIERLTVRFAGRIVMNESGHLFTGNYDAGYVGELILPSRGWHERHHAIRFMISFLVPCYVVYSAANVLAPVTDGGQVNRHINFTFTPDEEPHVRTLTEEILAFFPGYEPMPPEIGSLPLPADIKSFGEGTIQEALFSTAI